MSEWFEKPYLNDTRFAPLDLTGRLSDLDIEQMSVLDLGCGRNDGFISHQVLEIPCARLYSVDGYAPYLRELERKPCAAREHLVVCADVRKAFEWMDEHQAPTPDVILMLDVLEHLEITDAEALLEQIEQRAGVRALIWLPWGETPQGADAWGDGNDLQEHRSTWYPSELAERGWEVTVYQGFHRHFSPPVDAGWAIMDKLR